MSRIPPPEIDESLPAVAAAAANGGHEDPAATRRGRLRSIRDRFRFKGNPKLTIPITAAPASAANKTPPPKSPSLDRPYLRYRCNQAPSLATSTSSKSPSGGGGHHPNHHRRGFLLFPFRGVYLFYLVIFFAVFAFVMASVLLQSSIADGLFSVRGWGSGDHPLHRRRAVGQVLKLGSRLRFVPGWRSRQLVEGSGLDEVRISQGSTRVGLRPPRLALILGNMNKDPQTLLLVTLITSLQKLGYAFKLYAIENGKAQSIWEQIGGSISILSPQRYNRVDWSSFEGVIADSLEAKEAISSLMQEPFCSIPLIWIIQEDTLASRLPMYEEMGWKHLVSHWKSAFNRADVVFPDFTLPMLYGVLDSGNFVVIPGTPADVWAAESYSKTHSKNELRAENQFGMNDIMVLVVGSSFFYDELSWDYAMAMHALRPLLVKYASKRDAEESFKFVFLCGNSTDGDSLQEVASRLGLLPGSILHYGMNDDVNSVLLMADIVLYGASQDEQGFPPLIIRAMTFGLPVIAPDFPIIKKYVTDGVDGLLFRKHDPEALMRTFLLLASDGKLSRLARSVANSGRQLVKNVLASECAIRFARLLENVLSFPSDALLPGPVSQLQQDVWDWNLFKKEIEQEADDLLDERDSSIRESSVVYTLEEEFTDLVNSTKLSENETEILVPDMPSELDFKVLEEIESSEEYERVETEEIDERMDQSPAIWDDVYRNARKSEKLSFEVNERDEGELERTGQPVCIYEIYDGPGAWPFLHHGSLYRGLSLSTRARRSRSDDVNAVGRLPLLNDTEYQNKLCEIGGMFSIANRVDNIHRRPWIGFQSWRAAGRKVSLSNKAEKVLEEKIQKEMRGDVMYFWAKLDMDGGVAGSNSELTFWSMCDILNGGQCRTSFEDSFLQMYALPSYLEALPPMPEDGGHWSALHSWVMPTPSFLEFIMFSRMFVDSLDALQTNSSQPNKCLLSLSKHEERHCYCRIMELLVNVWAYHSGRRMVYIDPRTGSLEEQHPIEKRKGIMWGKYFNLTLLKSMDEELAETADDGDHPRERWLWPLTGEVHWQGIYEREREERYRLKMDKKRKTKEKLNERMKSGYKQKPLGG